jgi:MOSC domain-containing protein YiiM
MSRRTRSTKSGLDINAAMIGETWQLRTAVVQITGARISCVASGPGWARSTGYGDSPGPGAPARYLRVLAEGSVSAGDDVRLLDRPACHVTVVESMPASCGDQDLMRWLLEVEGRGEKWDEAGLHILGRAGV